MSLRKLSHKIIIFKLIKTAKRSLLSREVKISKELIVKAKVMWFFFLNHFPNSPTALAQILREARDSMTSMQTALDRYSTLLDTNTPEVSKFTTLV